MYCSGCGIKNKDDTSFCYSCGASIGKDSVIGDKMEKKEKLGKKKNQGKKKTAYWLVVIGTVVLFIESVIDFFARDFYAATEIPGIQLSPEIIAIMAIIGMIISIFLAFFIFYAQNKSYYYIVLLIVSMLAFFSSYAVLGPVLLFVGSIIGTTRKDVMENEDNKNVA